MPLSDTKILSYESFILFNSLSTRIPANEILYKGFELQNIVSEIVHFVSKKNELKYKGLYNNIEKIQKMLEMAHPNDVAMTRFFNRIRSSHRHISSIGEKFVTLNIFLGVFPQDFNDLIEIKTVKLEPEVFNDIEI
jgi:hypothetical protein